MSRGPGFQGAVRCPSSRLPGDSGHRQLCPDFGACTLHSVASSLTLLEGTREATRDRGRVRRSRRSFVEFVVDGEPLAGRLDDAIQGMDLVPVLVLDWPAGFPAEDYQRLTGETASTPQGDRVALYICPECGDIGCGAITAAIEQRVDTVVWRDFRYQTNFDRVDADDVLPDVDPIVFDRDAYLEVLTEFRGRWLSSHGI